MLIKIIDKELFKLLSQLVRSGSYVFKKHARDRQETRSIQDLEVLNILEGKKGHRRHRNKAKDSLRADRKGWKYCLEGVNIDNNKMRIIITFEAELLLIITVMWIE